MALLFLACAIAAEVIATLSLRAAAAGRNLLYVVVGVGYLSAFGALLASLRHGMPLGIAYGIWAAAGVALTALASRILFGEMLTRRMIAGIGLIAAGVLLMELGGTG
ncbi:putative drug resistance transporter [Gordonia effusa NBRC 100432]|uniref:Putative drug resistance transporter n=1 Tax=Gordonia effusa NBRC 100432 TaxID=1077974 RepID=H0QVD9_9ACTN|nr:SMR family transporter [Gordonia effusa]GAB16790.1 putative drug resistance transporter [Gordonia effusa NBRC 100432]